MAEWEGVAGEERERVESLFQELSPEDSLNDVFQGPTRLIRGRLSGLFRRKSSAVLSASPFPAPPAPSLSPWLPSCLPLFYYHHREMEALAMKQPAWADDKLQTGQGMVSRVSRMWVSRGEGDGSLCTLITFCSSSAAALTGLRTG